jgi:hypothetical protein
MRRSKSDLQEVITRLKKEVDELKAQRKPTQRHIAYKDLPADARFDRLSTQSKHLVDTIKMIACRAEAAMPQMVRQTMSRHDDARSLLRAVYNTEIDLIPDQEANSLTVRLHPLANTSSNQTLKHLCAEITATEPQFRGTELRLTYELVSASLRSGNLGWLRSPGPAFSCLLNSPQALRAFAGVCPMVRMLFFGAGSG